MIRAAAELETLARMVSVLRAENEGLRTDVRRLREEPRTIEELARRELGLILPGETLFIVTGAPPAGHAPDAVSAEALTADPSGH